MVFFLIQYIGRREIKHFTIRGKTRSFGRQNNRPRLAWDFMGIDGHSIWFVLRGTHMYSKSVPPTVEVATRCRVRRHIFKQTFFMDQFVLVSNKTLRYFHIYIQDGLDRLILRMYCMSSSSNRSVKFT